MSSITEQLVGAVKALQGQISTMEQQIQQTQTQVTANGVRSNGPRLPKPPFFTGRGRNTSVVNWTHQMETFLVANSLDLTTAQAVQYAAGYLTDSALTWYRLQLQSAQQGRADTLKNWADFKAALISSFQPIAPERAARDKLSTLHQIKSVKQYAEIYNQCMLEIPDMAEGDRIDGFLRGLRPKVRLHVELQKPTALASAIELAIQVDTLMHRTERGSSRQYNNYRDFPVSQDRFYETTPSQKTYREDDHRGNFSIPQTNNGPMPMELGTTTSRFVVREHSNPQKSENSKYNSYHDGEEADDARNRRRWTERCYMPLLQRTRPHCERLSKETAQETGIRPGQQTSTDMPKCKGVKTQACS